MTTAGTRFANAQKSIPSTSPSQSSASSSALCILADKPPMIAFNNEMDLARLLEEHRRRTLNEQEQDADCNKVADETTALSSFEGTANRMGRSLTTSPSAPRHAEGIPAAAEAMRARNNSGLSTIAYSDPGGYDSAARNMFLANALHGSAAGAAGTGRVGGVGLSQYHHHGLLSSPATSSTAAAALSASDSYTVALQQRLLDEQVRRDLVAQALLNAQVARSGGGSAGATIAGLDGAGVPLSMMHSSAAASSQGNVTDLLVQLGMLRQRVHAPSFFRGGSEAAAEADHLNGLATAEQHAAAKRQRTLGEMSVSGAAAAATAASFPGMKGAAASNPIAELKTTTPSFFLPAASGDAKYMSTGTLSSFREAWHRLGSSTSITDPDQKMRFVKEFFSRRLSSTSANTMRVSTQVGAAASSVEGRGKRPPLRKRKY